MNTIRIAGIEPLSSVDGPGLRYTVFTQGCINDCAYCHNRSTHNYYNGYETSVETILKDIEKYNTIIHGITLSGGDPLFILNYSSVTELCKRYKEAYPNKTIILYTGYLYEDVLKSRSEILDYIDIIIDGKYIDSLKSFEHPFRGSSNQRMIDVRKSIEYNKVIEYQLQN